MVGQETTDVHMFLTEQNLQKRHLSWQRDVKKNASDDTSPAYDHPEDASILYFRTDVGGDLRDQSQLLTSCAPPTHYHNAMSAVETPERPDASNFPSVGDKSPTTFSDSPAQAPHNYYYPSSSSDALPNAYSMSHTAYAHNAAYDFYKQFGHFSDPRMNLHQRQHPYTMSETKTSQYNQRANSSNEPSHYDKHRQDANGVCKTEANNEDKESNPVKFSLKANGDSPPPPKLIPIGERTWHKPSSNGPQEPGRDSQTPRSTENDRSPEENDPPSESEPQDSHTPAEKSPSGRRSPRLEFHEDDNFNSSKNSYDKKPLTPTSSAGQSNHDPSHPQSPRERDQSSPEPRESEHQMDESRPKKDRQSAGNETDRSRARQESRNYEQMSGNDRRSLSPISEAGEGENTNPNRASSPADSRDGGTRDGRPSYDFSQVRDRTVDSPEDMRSNDSMSPERYRSHSFSYSPGRLQSQLRGDSRRFSRDTSPPPGYHHMADGNVYYNMNQEGGVINPMYPIRPDPLTALLQKYSGPVPSFQFPGVQPLGHENHYGKGSNGLPSTPPKYPISSNNGFSPARVALSPRQPDSFPSPATPTRSRSLDAEMPRQSNQEFYYCHLCSYVGNSKFHFNAHMNSHFEHACPHCDYTSRTEGRLKRHIKDFHTEEVSESGQMMRRQPGRPKIFKCRQCEFVTENKEQFWDHSRTHIKDDKILQCPKCPFVTEYKHHLEYHLRNHFGSKPFKCPKCNYSCVNKSMLNSHMKSHTNVYQYRCADCTYATKYCHSLKLHLKKYNHKPATVLNPDGSLPTDGSGDFELVSKRGPPRGPRGPKRDSKSPPPPSQAPVFPSPNMMMTPPQPPVAIMSAPSGPMPPQMNGSMVATNNYWSPSMLGQTPSAIQGHPPPLIPVSTVSTMNPLNVQVPPTSRSFPSNHLNPSSLGHKEAQDLSNKYSPVEADGSLNLTSKPIEISPITSGMPMKCRFCEFSADSRQILLQHNLRVHAAENQDLFTVFGIRAETLVGGGEEQQSSEAIREAIMRSSSMLGIKSEDQPRSSLVASSSPPAVIKHSPSFAMKETVSQDIMASIEAETRQSSESPLDLSTIDKYSNGTQIDDDDPKAYAVSCRKRSSDDSQNSYDGLTPSDSMSSSPRKRSRKGKAYKLDVISMKLQGRFDGSPALNEDAEEEECVLSDYASDDNKLDASQSEPDRTILSQPHESVEEISYNLAERNDESNSDNQESTHKSPNVHEDTSFNSKLSRVAEIPNAHKVLQVMQRLEAEYGGRQGKPRLSLDYKASTNGEKSDDEISKFECLHCGIFFSDCIMYTMHMGYHGYKDPFKCNMCGHQSSDKVEFFLHIARAAHA